MAFVGFSINEQTMMIAIKIVIVWLVLPAILNFFWYWPLDSSNFTLSESWKEGGNGFQFIFSHWNKPYPIYCFHFHLFLASSFVFLTLNLVAFLGWLLYLGGSQSNGCSNHWIGTNNIFLKKNIWMYVPIFIPSTHFH